MIRSHIILCLAAVVAFASPTVTRADDLGSIDTGAGRNIDSGGRIGGVGGSRGAGMERGNDDSAFDREPSNYEQVESEMERSTGRIVDQQTWELDQIERQRDPQRPFDELQEDLDRQERIDNVRWRAMLQQRLDAFMQVPPPRQGVMLSDSAISPIIGTPLLRWIIETSQALESTQPTTQPSPQ